MPTFPTLTAIDVAIKVPCGTIEIVASDRRDAVVTVSPSNPRREQDVRAANETSVEFDGSRLIVTAPKPRVAIFGPTESVEVTIEIPEGSNVTADAGFGAVRASGTLGTANVNGGHGDIELDATGDLFAHASHGQIRIGDVNGSVEAECSHGSIRVKSATGAAKVKSSHGSITLGEIGGEITAKSSYGDVDIAAARGGVTAKTAYGAIDIREVSAGEIDLETSYGSVTVGVRDGVKAFLDLSSKAGRVRNDLESSSAPESGAQTVKVFAHTNVGDVRVRRAR
mgnify:CR=1 FL=1